MENYQGDLTDIVRAAAGDSLPSDWQFPTSDLHHHSVNIFDDHDQQPITALDGFGNPFSNMRDPLLHDLLHTPTTTASSCSLPFTLSSTAAVAAPSASSKEMIITGPATAAPDEEGSKRFSQMLHISKLVVPNNNTPNSSSLPHNLQISSPRNPGVKRRKSQAKKVVVIPAPASANSRPTGEIVPSDLWAWRKYGQKPIKGSPYPRGYYRCSSSKGCSARKQVERSRTDPNMLVITYTSEHNHPWPTQRNALAGSTRSQPSTKPNSSNSKTTTPTTTTTITKSEEQHVHNKATNDNTTTDSPSNTINNVASVKDAEDHFSYRPEMPNNQINIVSDQDSFFADLGEIEPDLLFTQGFNDHEKHKDETKDFNIFDWSQDISNKGL